MTKGTFRGGWPATTSLAMVDLGVSRLQAGAESGEKVLKNAVNGNPVFDLADGIENRCVIAIAEEASHLFKGVIGVLTGQKHAYLSG